MANENTTSTLSELIQAQIGRAMDDEIAQHLFFPGAAASSWIKLRDLSGTTGISATFPKYNALTATALSEATDLTTNSPLNPTDTTLTAAAVGLKGTTTDLAAQALAGPNAAAVYAADQARNHVKAIMTKYDVDVFSLFESLDDGVENTTVNLTDANVLSCLEKCAVANMPTPWAGFLHPEQYTDLLTESATSPWKDASVSTINEQYTNYLITHMYGVTWFVSTNVQTANAGADWAGAIISPEAIGSVIASMPKTEPQRDASLLATEYVTAMAYAVGEIDGTMGMYLISDKN